MRGENDRTHPKRARTLVVLAHPVADEESMLRLNRDGF